MQKTLFLLISFLVYFSLQSKAQIKSPYDKEWNEITNLLEKNELPKTALSKVISIYDRAKKDKNENEQLKALIYRIRIQQLIFDNYDIESIKLLENEILEAKQPIKSVLYSLTAEAYNQYLQNNSWVIYERTHTDKPENAPIDTWDMKDFHKKINACYLSSVSEYQLLSSLSVDQFNAVLIKGNSMALRPTLYDLLAHRALDYYEDESRIISEEDELTEHFSEIYFSDAKLFSGHEFKSGNQNSGLYNACLIYQQLLGLHIKTKNTNAFIDVELRRLNFAERFSKNQAKDSLYESALKNIIQNNKETADISEVVYSLASIYRIKASNYNFKIDTGSDSSNPRWYYRKAYDLLKPYATSNINSNGVSLCKNLYNLIKEKNISFEVEEVNSANKPFRLLISYQNTPDIWIRIIPVNKSQINEFNNSSWEDENWRKIIASKSLLNLSQKLPSSEDFLNHNTEIAVPALKPGRYAILISSGEEFSIAKDKMAMQFITVSNIVWLKKENKIFVLDRESGNPIQNAKVQEYSNIYSYEKGKYELIKKKLYTSLNDGSVDLITAEEDRDDKYIEVYNGSDTLYLENSVNTYIWDPYKEEDSTAESLKNLIFTDRMVYRPGQTVYFKGILVSYNQKIKQPKSIANKKVVLYLFSDYDAITDSVEIITNEFGSYSGTFNIPLNSINGEYSISDNISDESYSFIVEEYKRPKFYVQLERPKNTYKVNDIIQINGQATAYAGYAMSNASIKYRIVRRPELSYPWPYYRWGWTDVNEQEIFSGKTTADQKGNFQISFNAIPDLKIQKEFNPIFNYEIIAEATDISGETQNSSINILAGYQSVILQLKVTEGEFIVADSLKSISVSTVNTMQVFEARTVQLNIFKLKTPDRLIRKRYWDEPDQHVLSEKEYLKLFPNDEYKNETEIETWQKTEMVFAKTQKTAENKQFELNKKLIPGWYVAEAVTYDKDSFPIKQAVYFEIRANENAIPSAPTPFWLSNTDSQRQPGDEVVLTMGSTNENIFLIRNSWNSKSQKIEWQSGYLKTQKTDKIKLDTSPNNIVSYTYTFIKNNRQYSFTRNFEIKEKDKDLTITVESFRDKTAPGNAEEWRIHIKNNNGKKEQAEVLTSMYDASLDAILANNWQRPDFSDYFYSEPEWITGGLGSLNSYYKSGQEYEYSFFDKIYDRLLDISYSSPHFYIRGGADMDVDYKKDTSAAVEIMSKSSANIPSEEFEKKSPASPKTIDNIRKNFKETAFFFPQLYPDTSGNLTIKFKMPDGLTRWKWQVFAHTKNLTTGLITREITSTKELITEPNIPRFLREGDQLSLAVRISNTGTTTLSGECKLELFNNGGKNSTDGWFQNLFPVQYFSVEPGNNQLVRFPIKVPYQFSDLLTYRITATANGNKNIRLTDGEEGVIPVLPNEVLLTETLPIFMHSGEEKNISWDNLKSSGNSESINNKALTIEFTTNPVWSAVKSLPYIVSSNNESADAVWNRFYANSLASHILQQNPEIGNIIKTWETKDSSAFLSQLEKNPELKSLLLSETPWIGAAENERMQYELLKKLFDQQLIKSEQKNAITTLKAYQASSGGFIWFKGGQEDRYMTQYILTGIGQLLKLNTLDKELASELQSIAENGVNYLDNRLLFDYEILKKKKLNKNNYRPGALETEQLYMRSFFPGIPYSGGTEKAYRFYYNCAKRNWNKQSIYVNALTLMILQRNGDEKMINKIAASVKEKSIEEKEKGIYFSRSQQFYGYHSQEEIQAVVIEAFQEINKDDQFIEGLKTWLLQQKRTQQWSSNLATAKACYALLQSGKPWQKQNNEIKISLGTTSYSSNKLDKQAGSGYFKEVINGNNINPEMGNIKIVSEKSNEANIPVWGGIYWQYSDKIENISNSTSSISVAREFYLQKIENDKTSLIQISDTTKIVSGDKILVRWTIKNDRLLEYVSLKDLRAACFEPSEKTSGYKWKDGIGYFESIRDAGNEFFFERLPAGTFLIESTFYVNQSGVFSLGYANVQCMYAPEISAHSEGGNIQVAISE